MTDKSVLYVAMLAWNLAVWAAFFYAVIILDKSAWWALLAIILTAWPES